MTKLTRTQAMAEIINKLDGKVQFEGIRFDQIMQCKPGESVNNLLFVKRAYGVYFYTEKSTFEDSIMTLNTNALGKLKTLAVVDGSQDVFCLTKLGGVY